jgi:glycosyltransferase involved in cell wall biosynthesis
MSASVRPTVNPALVSVIIPCFKQAHFLPESIESALAQTYPRVEIIVVDDGSPDETAAVAARYPAVKYVRQSNQGLSRARNTGFRHSSGEYVVFLDSDDRLFPDALAVNLEILEARPDCAFVSGHYHFIDAAGTVFDEWEAEPVESDPYIHLLKRNYIGNPATVMFRRETVRILGGFRTWPAAEDYDAYLRVTRMFPVCYHGRIIVGYRRHGHAMSDDPVRMLIGTVSVLQEQWVHVRNNPAHLAAYRHGIQNSRDHYLNASIEYVRRKLQTPGERQRALRALATLTWWLPPEAIFLVRALARGDQQWQRTASTAVPE